MGPEAPQLEHFDDAAGVLGRLESRQAERRKLSRRDDTAQSAFTVEATSRSQRARELCHDMRQPLAVIVSIMADLDPEGLSSAGRDRLQEVLEQTQRLSMFVASCLSPPQRSSVDLHGLVDAVARSAAVTFGGTLEVVGSDQPVVHGDPTLLDRALTNVLDNACRAAGGHGHVRVVLWAASDGARVDIDDDGPGLGRSAASGHGLGLTIVQAVLDEHGGTLSTGPGVLGGTRVRLRLPLIVPTQRCREDRR